MAMIFNHPGHHDSEPQRSDFVEWTHCPECGWWGLVFRGQCIECFEAANPQIVHRTLRQDLRRDWELKLQPWLYARYQRAADPVKWPSAIALIGIGFFIASHIGRFG